MKYIVYISLFLITLNSIAQNYADKKYYLVDSLDLTSLTDSDKELLETSLKKYHAAKDDTSKVNALTDICENMVHVDWSKYQFYQYEIIKSALNNDKPHTIQEIRILTNSLTGALNNIGYYYQHHGNISKSLDYNIKSLKLSEKLGDKKGIAQSLNNIGSIYGDRGDIVKQTNYYHKTLKLYQELGDKKGIARSLNNIGLIFHNQGDMPKALEYYIKSLKLSEEIVEEDHIASNLIAINLNNIGYLYKAQGDFTKALVYYQKSLKLQEKLGNKNGIANSLNNIGAIYQNQGDIPKSSEYHIKSLKLREELGNKNAIAQSLNNIGTNYRILGDYTKALDFYQRSLKLREELGEKRGIANSLNNIAEIEIKQLELGQEKVFSNAENYLLKGLQLSKEGGYSEMKIPIYKNLSRLFKITNRYKNALEMYELHITMRDSINNEETQKATIQQQAKFEYEKQKAIDDKEHEKQLAIEQEAKKKQKVITYATTSGLVLVALFLIFVFNRLQVTKRQKLVIEQQKVEVEQQKQQVETAHQQLEEKNEEIIASIRYAKRIQDALMTSQKYIERNISRLKGDKN